MYGQDRRSKATIHAVYYVFHEDETEATLLVDATNELELSEATILAECYEDETEATLLVNATNAAKQLDQTSTTSDHNSLQS